MKSFKMLLMAALTLISVSLFAQKDQKTKIPVKKSKTTAYYTCPMHPEITSSKPGKCPKCGMALNLSKKEQMKMEIVKIYTCPMHPEVAAKSPGKCPKCGMALEEKKNEKNDSK